MSRAGWTAFVIGVSFIGLMGLVMILWPHPLISAFIDIANPANARVIALAVFVAGLRGAVCRNKSGC